MQYADQYTAFWARVFDLLSNTQYLEKSDLRGLSCSWLLKRLSFPIALFREKLSGGFKKPSNQL